MSEPVGFPSRLFVSGMSAFVLIGLLGAIYGVALPGFTRLYGLDTGSASLILTTHAFGGMLAIIAVMAGLRGLGSRTAMALMAAGTGLIALLPGWPLTLAGSLIAGSGFGLIATHVNRDFLTGFGTRGPGMVGLVNGISGVGLILGPLLYVWSGNSITLIFAGIGLFSLALIALFAPSATNGTTSLNRLDLMNWRVGILGLNVVSVGLEMALTGLGVTALIALGWAENTAATLSSGFFAAFLIARLNLFWLTRYIAADRMFLIGTVGTVAATALAASGWAGIGYVMAGGFVGFAFPSFFVWGTRVLGSDPRMSAAMLLSGLSGAAIGPFVFAELLSRIGLENLFVAVALTGAVLAMVIVAAIGPANRIHNQPCPA